MLFLEWIAVRSDRSNTVFVDDPDAIRLGSDPRSCLCVDAVKYERRSANPFQLFAKSPKYNLNSGENQLSLGAEHDGKTRTDQFVCIAP